MLSMQAILAHEFGGPEVLTLENVPDPVAGGERGEKPWGGMTTPGGINCDSMSASGVCVMLTSIAARAIVPMFGTAIECEMPAVVYSGIAKPRLEGDLNT